MTAAIEAGLDLRGLVDVLRRAPGLGAVSEALARGDSAVVDGAWGSSCALTAATLVDEVARRRKKALPCPAFVIVLPRISEVDDFAVDLAEFAGRPPVIFPAWESIPRERGLADPVFSSRLRILRELEQLSGDEPLLLVTSIAALLQPVPSRAELARSTRTLKVGETLDPEDFARWLAERGFERTTTIEYPGEFSIHGGIIDLFAPTEAAPLRVEFFGDEVESIRRFDLETQRKIEDLRDVALTVLSPEGEAGELPARRGRRADADAEAEAMGATGGLPASANRRSLGTGGQAASGTRTNRMETEHFADALPRGTRIALVELSELTDEGRHFLERLDHPRSYSTVEQTLKKCIAFPTVTIAALAGESFETTCHLKVQSVERFQTPAAQIKEELGKVVGKEEHVLIACHNAGERDRLEELFEDTELARSRRLHLCEGHVLHGFRLINERLIVLSDHELFNRRDIRRAAPKATLANLETRAIDSFLELSPGDYVVHLTKGIARFRGMEILSAKGQQEEHLVLEYRDAMKVYVPAGMIHLVQKYIGGSGGVAPTLSKLGSGSWERKKQAVMEAVTDLAGEMIQLQAERASRPGHAFPEDSHWQQEFEAAFPYTPTPDQHTAIAAIKADMQRSRPMDRLLCGDVGYGKTEVALRGVFKAIDAGRQVAVLVPTTVLAEQHYRTFCERLAEYPFNVEVLSRFRTASQQRKTLERLASGGVDVVIGTHRLVQPDVKFKDLGLVIIDEEQRFGVAHKDKLKTLRLEVDVLTMSATPIPRTLHMSLIGIRDISNLQTPPHDRLAIETRVSRFDKELIRQAIIRELNRGGQVYFVHNRVYNIQTIADTVQAIVPEARIGIVHGQMPEWELEESMVKFVNGELDVLVATTIIESGLDIPNANTIFIHKADKYGLADLHQLRGRVGRYKHRAYCYLMLEEGQSLSSTAAKRLKAIEEFSELGAGFKIAMRDLEIRGAGNILGNEQSGHIASIGYELYCQILENCVRGLQGVPLRQVEHVSIDLPLSAFLPGSYVPPGRHKIEAYRKLSQVQSQEQLAELEAEFRDRFGPIPEVAQNLLSLKSIELLARLWGIDDIHFEDRFLVFRYTDADRIRKLNRLRPELRIVDRRSAYWPLPMGFSITADDAGDYLSTLTRSLLDRGVSEVRGTKASSVE